MSSPAALATVTATLQNLLANVVPAATVTTKPPSTARIGISGDQINVFLYTTYYNTAFSNAPMPGEFRSGEAAFPPLPLVLKYLITAYGANDDDILGQQLMGEAMSLFHDHPILGESDINGITPDSSLHEQFESVRITPDTLTLDDMSKLWTSFQSAEYRLSMGYEISVVLIESSRDSRTPLPVLKRGDSDQGADVITAPAPTLQGLRFANQKPSAELGDVVTLLGSNLSATNTMVRFTHPLMSNPIEIAPQSGLTPDELIITLPSISDDATLVSQWPAGFYQLLLVTQQPNTPTYTSNTVFMPLSPKIESLSPPADTAGNIVLTLECSPQIDPNQHVALLFGERKIAPQAFALPAGPADLSTLVFNIEDARAKPTPYIVRVRVDGADSIPVDFSGPTPEFANNQKVTIT